MRLYESTMQLYTYNFNNLIMSYRIKTPCIESKSPQCEEQVSGQDIAYMSLGEVKREDKCCGIGKKMERAVKRFKLCDVI